MRKLIIWIVWYFVGAFLMYTCDAPTYIQIIGGWILADMNTRDIL